MLTPIEKLKLQGFNNLTKTFSFNLYDVCYAGTAAQRGAYIKYIDEVYSSTRLTRMLVCIAEMIGAMVLNIAHQDYHPQGASATALIAEESLGNAGDGRVDLSGHGSEAVVMHLDKSHITVHTYPESHPENAISTLRADIDVATCGEVTPLKAVDYLIGSFKSDVVIMDYRVRGFTRDIDGRKHFMDHEINSIQDFIATATRSRYHMTDVNMYRQNIFHTKMMRKTFGLDDYLLGVGPSGLGKKERDSIHRRLKGEMEEIFRGCAANSPES